MSLRKRRRIRYAGHLHVHDEYSPLDGSGNRNQLSWAAARAGQTHLGFTNHGRLGGALEHVHACRHPEKYEHPLDPSQKRGKDERITPILGIEAFFRRDRFMDLTDQTIYGKNGHNWAHHLCVHAASLRGWQTLMRLSSKSWVRRENGGGFHGKPCFDFDMLENDNEDVIISTACLASPLAYYILNGDEKGAKKFVRRMRKVSKNGIVWFEIMPHDLDAQRELNMGIVNLAYETGDPIIATGDVHIPFGTEDWIRTHEVVRMASYKQTFEHRESKKDAGEDVYTDRIDTVFLSSAEQMFKQFQKNHPDLPEDIVLEAMANTYDFAKQVRWYVISSTTKAPKVEVDANKSVKDWMLAGWREKQREYPKSHWKSWSQETYEKRMEMEFQVLDEKGVLDYFYIVGDFVRWAKSDKGLPAVDRKGKVRHNAATGEILYDGKKRPIRVGLGRGSAAGSLVSYLIGITAIDPIPHKLKFERFLNPDREGYPDIDMDFETEVPVITLDDGTVLDGRACVKEYLKRVYGHDHVVDIIAYQTFAPRVAIKEVCQVYDFNPNEVKKITETIGDTERGLERIASGKEAKNPGDKDIPPNEAVANLRDKNPELWEVLLNIEDQILRDTRHAGGVVITPKPTNFWIPTQLGADEITTVTAWADRADFPVMSDYGFLKYDILGVKSLAKQELACQLIKEHYDEEFEPNDLPALRDPYAVEQEVIDLFVKGVTWEVFQFGGRGITQLLRHIRPDNATDISVANALYRPGPIAIAFEYGDRKQGKVPITYWHDALEPILGETLGLMCFQEQAMEVAQELGNFTGGQADALRKAMSKLYRLPGDKAQEYMQQYYEQWVKGCEENGIPERESNPIWTDRFLPLGNYLFNRSHSSSYGLQAYQDAHIKYHYPLAFYASALTINRKNKREDEMERLKHGLREARIFDIEAAPPDVNRSDRGWSIDGRKLRYGLVGITGMGSGLAQEVIDHRPYEDFPDFIDEIPSGFGADKIVALSKAGAFDALEDRRYLLSRTRQWGEHVAKVDVKMSCGCKKTKTVKLPKEDYEGVDPADVAEMLEDAIEDALDAMVCKNHEDAEIAEVKRKDDTYEVARWYKEHPGEDPFVASEPDDAELAQMELDALNISLSQGMMMLRYKPFIDARIYTEEEVEELPAKPKKSGKKHGNFCSCDACEAASVVIGGEIINIKDIVTRKTKEPMGFIDVAYGANQYSCTLFPWVWKKYAHRLKEPTAFLISGHKDDRGQILVNEMVDVVQLAKDQEWDPDKVVSIGRGKKPKLKRKKIRRKKVA